MKDAAPRELTVRIALLAPPRGVTWRMQIGRAELQPPVEAAPERLVFETRLIAVPAPRGEFTFRGAAAQGPPAKRFLYLNSGTCAGQADSCWTRRAKVSLTGITPEQVEAALRDAGRALAVEIAGTGKDGGPACATVPLLGKGWQFAARDA